MIRWTEEKEGYRAVVRRGGPRDRLLCGILQSGERICPFGLSPLEPKDACRLAAMPNAVLLPPPRP